MHRDSTQDGTEEALEWREAEDVGVDDLPAVVVVLDHVLFVVHVVAREVVLQHARLRNRQTTSHVQVSLFTEASTAQENAFLHH